MNTFLEKLPNFKKFEITWWWSHDFGVVHMTSQVTNGSLKLSSKNYTFSSINFKRGVPSRRDDFKWDYTQTHTLNSTLHVIIYIFITVYSGQNPRNHVNLDVIKFQWLFFQYRIWDFKASLEPSHFFQKSMSERDGSDIQQLWNWTIKINWSFKFRVVPYRIRLIPTLISKIIINTLKKIMIFWNIGIWNSFILYFRSFITFLFT